MARFRKLLIAFFSLLTGIFVYSQEKTVLVWEEEFNGNSLDSKYWNIETGYGLWGNEELEEYTKRKNLKVADGYLEISATKIKSKYYSARINTKNKFSFVYGKIEARIRLPFGNGMWPAFWMMGHDFDTVGHPGCGEIDIVEMVGGSGEEKLSDRKIYSALHKPNDKFPSGIESMTGSFENESDLHEDFHIFSMDWNTNNIRFKIDDIEYYSIDIDGSENDVFRKRYFLILNLAVGGMWPGSPNENTQWPQKMVIDWIRVYQ